MVLRERKRKPVEEKAVVVITDNPIPPECDKVVIQVSDIQLYERDLDLLRSSRQWLNDTIVNAGQVLIKEMSPSTYGLQDVICSRTLTFQPEVKPFVQILNCRDSHWVCATNIGCKPNVVKVYDSMRTGDVTTSTKEDIATLLHSSEKRIYLLFPEVQQQTDGSSCGLFALAFAQTLAEGKDPSKVVYPSGADLRCHLLKCILAGRMTSFHKGSALYNPGPALKSVFRIYCTCRLVDRGDEMVFCNTCKEWFHFTCVNLQPGTKLKAKWNCISCSGSE